MEEDKNDKVDNMESKNSVAEQTKAKIETEIGQHSQKAREDERKRDPIGLMAWGAILIWAGFVFLADNLGWMENLQFPLWLPEEWHVIKDEIWTMIFLGAGVIVLFEGFIRLIFPGLRASAGGTFFMAFILLAIGLGNIYRWDIVWPIILIGLGLSMLVRALVRYRQ